jgi:hypothetical protein
VFLNQTFYVVQMIYKIRYCNTRIKSNILQKRCYAVKKILKVFLGISNTNAVISPKFYNKIKIRIIYIVPLVYF